VDDLCQHSFETLKNFLTPVPILQYPDFSRPFNLTCDTSNYTIGCVLSQEPIGKDLPIAYASRTLNKVEINYNTTQKELSSIDWGIKVFRSYLFGQKFNIITDHRALIWLFNLKNPGSRLTRWRLKLEEYQYTIQYKPGSSNTNADALSRIHRVVTRSSKTTEIIDSPKFPEHSDNPETTKEQSENSDTLESIRTQNPTNILETLQVLENSSNTSTGLELHSEEYQKFLSADPELKRPISNVVEVQGNLFEIDPHSVLAHCVSEDFKMSKGLVLAIGRKFGQVTQLRKQKKVITEISSIEADGRTILHLVTLLAETNVSEPIPNTSESQETLYGMSDTSNKLSTSRLLIRRA